MLLNLYRTPVLFAGRHSKTLITPKMSASKRNSSKNSGDSRVATLEALPTPVGATPSNSTEKLAKTFYRRTGALFLRPRIPLSNPHDREIWSLFGPALVALVLEPVQMAVETAVVGHLGIAPLGAVGFGTVVFQFALGFFAALIFATTPLVASRAAAGDTRGASRAAANGMWVGLGLGIVLQAAVWVLAPSIFAALSSDAEVASLATGYLQYRSWGIPAALVMMVAIGAARGHKDMAAPLVGAAAYGVALAVFDVALVSGAGLGVEGAGAAAALSQWMGAAAIIFWLIRREEFDVRDLVNIPGVSAAVPYLSMAPSLAVNSMAALAPMLCVTSLATSIGPDALAAHTVLRQLSGFWLQGFLAFNATAHSMVASALGDIHRRSGMDRASDILERICQLAVTCSLPVACVLLVSRSVLPLIFTSDATVVQDVALVLPFLLAYLPLDALGSSLEGGILGASDTKWIATRTTASSGVSLVALFAASTMGQGLMGVWVALKLLNLSALGLDLVRFMGPLAQQTASRKTSGSRRE